MSAEQDIRPAYTLSACGKHSPLYTIDRFEGFLKYKNASVRFLMI